MHTHGCPNKIVNALFMDAVTRRLWMYDTANVCACKMCDKFRKQYSSAFLVHVYDVIDIWKTTVYRCSFINSKCKTKNVPTRVCLPPGCIHRFLVRASAPIRAAPESRKICMKAGNSSGESPKWAITPPEPWQFSTETNSVDDDAVRSAVRALWRDMSCSTGNITDPLSWSKRKDVMPFWDNFPWLDEFKTGEMVRGHRMVPWEDCMSSRSAWCLVAALLASLLNPWKPVTI